MKKLMTLVAALLCMTAAHAQKYVGGDISLLTQYETHGAQYFDTDGTTPVTDLLGYFKSKGMNAMRVRLFVNPENATAAEKDQGVCQDLAFVTALGKRIKDAGFKLLLDFHYSDTWADPAKQWTPKEWLTLSDDELQTRIYQYTKECLQTMKDAGAEPDFIQTGNEISFGMLWGEGIIKTNTETTTEYETSASYKSVYAGQERNWSRFVGLLKQAGNACREICPQAKIVIHTERVLRPRYMVDFYNGLKNDGVDFDIMGLSYYSYYHGNFQTLTTALNYLNQFLPEKEIWMVEVGYYHHWQPATITGDYDLSATYPITPAGQQQYTEALIALLNQHPQVKGFFWWMMEANEHGLDWNTQRVTRAWYNAGLFDNSTGAAMPAINSLKSFLNDESAINTVRPSSTVGSRVYDLNGRQVARGAQSPMTLPKGVYIADGKKTVVR